MSDWDILAPVDDGHLEDDQDVDDEGNDGVFFADNGADNDSFGVGAPDENELEDDFPGPPRNEAQSFNPRMEGVGERFKRRDVFRHRGDYDVDPNDHPNANSPYQRRGPQQDQPQQQQQQSSNLYRDLSHSYNERKIHDADNSEFRNFNKGRRGYRGGRRGQRDMSDTSDAAMAAVPHGLLEDGFDETLYNEFHDAAVAQRAQLGIGNSPEMNSLYYFWCYYLRENFNQIMYDEFLETARQDIAGGSHYGIQCFFRLCSYGLEKRWDPDVFAQFQDEALADHRRGSLYGLEKVKSFLIHNKYDFPINQSEEMIAVLKQFPTLDSFKSSPLKINSNSNDNIRKPRVDNDNNNNSNNNNNIYEARSIPKNSFMRPQHQPPPPQQQQRRNTSRGAGVSGGNNNNNFNNNNANNNNANNNNTNANRQRGRGGNQRGQGRGRGGNKQLRHRNDEPREWTFGKMQPSSAPNLDSPMNF